MACCLPGLSAGTKSTADHTHERKDEWIYVVAGRASVRVGDQRFEVEAGVRVAGRLEARG